AGAGKTTLVNLFVPLQCEAIQVVKENGLEDKYPMQVNIRGRTLTTQLNRVELLPGSQMVQCEGARLMISPRQPTQQATTLEFQSIGEFEKWRKRFTHLVDRVETVGIEVQNYSIRPSIALADEVLGADASLQLTVMDFAGQHE